MMRRVPVLHIQVSCLIIDAEVCLVDGRYLAVMVEIVSGIFCVEILLDSYGLFISIFIHYYSYLISCGFMESLDFWS